MEQSFLAWLRGRARSLPGVRVGIGDDAAVIDWPAGNQLVVCVDSVTDRVDFIVGEHQLKDIGHKALAVNLSDLAAMAADPVAAFVAISLPNDHATEIAAGVYEGILPLASEFGLAVAGGDITVYDGPLSISITLIGRRLAGQCWLRSGAKVGDAVVVSGSLGGSILEHHLTFTPRVDLAKKIRDKYSIHAAIDISDGLLLDVDRLCAASGCGIEIDLSSVPISEAARACAERNDSDPLDHALGDGEDYELVMTCSQDVAEALLRDQVGVELTRIGTMSSRTGLWSKLPDRLERLLPRGFVHGQR